MIEQKRERILKLYGKGWSTRDIGIAVNETPLQVYELLKASGKNNCSPTGNTYAEDVALMTRSFEKCPGCGGRVQMPCLQCQLTAKKVSPPSGSAPVTENGSVI